MNSAAVSCTPSAVVGAGQVFRHSFFFTYLSPFPRKLGAVWCKWVRNNTLDILCFSSSVTISSYTDESLASRHVSQQYIKPLGYKLVRRGPAGRGWRPDCAAHRHQNVLCNARLVEEHISHRFEALRPGQINRMA